MELKQSTIAVVKIGPFCATTGTVLTALTIAQADVRLSKAGGDMAQKSTGTACTHDELGIYFCDLSAADTGTLGALRLDVDKSGSASLSVWEYFEVVSAQYFNAKYGTGRFEADVQEIDGASAGAVNMQNMYDGTGYAGGTIKLVTGPTAGTITDGAPSAADIIGSGTAATNITTFFDGTGYAGGTTKLGVDIISISGDSTAADNLESYTDGTSRIPVDVQEIDGGSAAAATFLTMYDGTGYAGGAIRLGADIQEIDGASAGIANLQDFFDGTGYAGGTVRLQTDIQEIDTASACVVNMQNMYDGTGYAGGTIRFGADVQEIDGGSAAAATFLTMYDGTGYAGGAIRFGADIQELDGASAGIANLQNFFDGTGYAGGTTKLKVHTDIFTAASLTAGVIAGSALTSGKFAASAFTIAHYDGTYRIYFSTGIQKNIAFNDLEFLMVDSTDHRTGKTGLGGNTGITMTRSIDGAAFATGSAGLAEIGNGIYVADLEASDTNGAVITLRFTADDADDTFITIKTSS